ncbi:DUF943 family protein [Enterobacteriaceae bacterium LUAb1]
MKANIKKPLFVLVVAGGTLISYFLWLTSRQVEIIAVHEDGNYSSVLVKNFPVTDRGKIDWWLKNKDMLKSRYDIPKPASYGGYDVTFWLFGDGYKEEGKYDRLCFKDMKPPVNCIEKDAIFSVDKSPNLGTTFTVYNGGDYRLDNNGRVVEVHRE